MENGNAHSKDFGRAFNFSAGPCCLPVEVLQEAQRDMLNCSGAKMGVMEMSHRSKAFLKVFTEAKNTLREVLQLPDNYHLLFMHGGATQQFAAVPLNLLSSQGAPADYAVTGSWSEKAYDESLKYSKADRVCNGKPSNYTSIPPVEQWTLNPNASYLHYCSNETIYGVEFKETPKSKVPLVCDMSSNFCSKPLEVEKHAVIYAGVQKNLGPASMAVVVVKDDYCKGKELPICPAVCSYKTTFDNDSMYNTPPCWTIYVTGLMAKYIKQKGGLQSMQELSEAKAKLLYDVVDNSEGYYTAPVNRECRSNMNVPFRVGAANETLEKKFLCEAEKVDLLTLGGHRSVGGCRASLYNGMPKEGVVKLTDFMKSFQQENPI